MINLIPNFCLKVLLVFSISPGSKFTRKEIKKYSELNNVTLDESLNILVNLKLLEKNKFLYYLNLEKTELILKDIKSKFSGLPLKVQFQLIDYIESIKKMKGIKQIILFGSFSKLTFNKNSDLDIAIITEKPLEKAIEKINNKLLKKYSRETETHIFKEEDLKNKKDPLIKDILKNGRNLI